jgi:zinc transporter, ZIP family
VADAVVLLLAASATALATGLGAAPVFLLGARAQSVEPFLWGLAAGVMTVAAAVGLIKPAFDEGSAGLVVAGIAAGVAFLALSRGLLKERSRHVRRLRDADVRSAALIFGVLAVHSLPEGLAIGSAYASSVAGLAAFVVIGIGLQNIPEGTSVAIPLAEAGYGRSTQFWGAVLTSAPQPVGALFAFALVDVAASVLPFSLAFAGGAMGALVLVELLPRIAHRGRLLLGGTGLCCGLVVMLCADLLLRA